MSAGRDLKVKLPAGARLPPEKAPPASGPLVFLPGVTLFNQRYADVPWLVEGLIARGALFCVNGKGGLWKSWLMTHLGVQVALSRNFLERFRCPVNEPRNSVLFVQLEESPRQAQKKFRWMCRGQSLTPEQIMDLSMGYIVGQPFRLDNPARFDQLKLHVEQLEPDLVLWDNARKMKRGNENDSEWADEIAFKLRELQEVHPSAHGLIHHWRKKSNDRHASNDPSEMGRGSGALRDAMDVWLPIEADPTGLVTMTQDKNRDGALVPPFNYRLRLADDLAFANATFIGSAGGTETNDCQSSVLHFLESLPRRAPVRRVEIVKALADRFREDQVKSAVALLERRRLVAVSAPGTGGRGSGVSVLLRDPTEEARSADSLFESIGRSEIPTNPLELDTPNA